MRLENTAQNISFETGTEWVSSEGWTDPAVHDTHGFCLRSVIHPDVQIQVRGETIVHQELSRDGLLRWLREQRWASLPFDEMTLTVGTLTIVAGTYQTPFKHGLVVREWFVTDGRSLANAAMLATRAQVTVAADAATKLVASIQFGPSV